MTLRGKSDAEDIAPGTLARIVPAPAPSYVICDARKSACICHEPAEHEGPHVCSCGGSWDDDGRVYELPSGGSYPE